MRVLLVSPNVERLKMPALPLGLAHVCAATRQAGHEVRYLDLLGRSEPESALFSAIAESSPEVIGVTVRNIDNQDMLHPVFLLERVRSLLRRCRASSPAPVVLGGAGYSMYPRATLEFLDADYGIAGEGERVFPLLLEHLEKRADPRGLPGVWVRGADRAGPREFASLDQLPLADPALVGSADLNDPDLWVPVQTRRGCPFDCAYCSTASIEGRSLRMHQPQRVAEYLAEAVAAGATRFYFSDNTFNLPASYALELCRAFTSRGLPIQWRAILYPRQVPDELVDAMAAAGCVEASLGFESGALPVLRAMRKQFEPEEVRALSDRLAAAGIRRTGFLLLGGPEETRETVDESVAFADSLRLEMLNLTAGIRIYPQTLLARIAIEEGVIRGDDDLLEPRFYLRPAVADYVREVVQSRSPS